MKYKVFYKTDNGKNFFERVSADTPYEAETKVLANHNDIAEIVTTLID